MIVPPLRWILSFLHTGCVTKIRNPWVAPCTLSWTECHFIHALFPFLHEYCYYEANVPPVAAMTLLTATSPATNAMILHGLP